MVNWEEGVGGRGLWGRYGKWIGEEWGGGREFESLKGIGGEEERIVGFRGVMGGGMDYSGGIFEGDLWVYGSKKGKVGSRVVKEVGVYVRM